MKLFALAAAQAALAGTASASYINYTTVTGYFLQDNNATNATTFDYVSCSTVSNTCYC